MFVHLHTPVTYIRLEITVLYNDQQCSDMSCNVSSTNDQQCSNMSCNVSSTNDQQCSNMSCKVSSTNDQQCSNMSCNVSSIAQTCLHLTSVPKQLEILWGPDNGQDRNNSDLIPLWFDEILENGYPDDDILVELETTMEQIYN